MPTPLLSGSKMHYTTQNILLKCHTRPLFQKDRICQQESFLQTEIKKKKSCGFQGALYVLEPPRAPRKKKMKLIPHADLANSLSSQHSRVANPVSIQKDLWKHSSRDIPNNIGINPNQFHTLWRLWRFWVNFISHLFNN